MRKICPECYLREVKETLALCDKCLAEQSFREKQMYDKGTAVGGIITVETEEHGRA